MTKKNKYLPLSVYLKPEEDSELIQALQQMAVEHKMSLSGVVRLVLLSSTEKLSKGFSVNSTSVVGESKTTKVIPLRVKK